MIDFLVNWITGMPVTAAPALAALGLISPERSGVLNLAEG
jgi:ABC-type uncharacterized transport system permease subunit